MSRMGLNSLKQFSRDSRLWPLRIPIEIEAEGAKYLRLGPAMHGNIVPTQQELARSERPVRFLPLLE